MSKINKVLIDTAEDIDVVMPMYKLLEYSENYKFWVSLLNTKAVLQEKHQMKIKKTVKTPSKKIQRLNKILTLLPH